MNARPERQTCRKLPESDPIGQAFGYSIDIPRLRDDPASTGVERLRWVTVCAATVALLLLMAIPCSSFAGTIEHRGGEIVFSREAFAVAFSDVNGSIRSVTMHGKSGSILQSGEEGLWKATYKEGGDVNAADFAADSVTRPFRWSAGTDDEALRLSYAGADITATVTVAGRTDGLDFTATVEPASKTVLEFRSSCSRAFYSGPDGAAGLSAECE